LTANVTMLCTNLPYTTMALTSK